MSCTTDSGARGFTLVEMMLVISLIAVVLAMSGTSLLDQLRAQQVAIAINQGRDMATIIEQIRPAIRKGGSVFLPAPVNDDYIYNNTLTGFMTDMDAEPTLKSNFLGRISTVENILEASSGSAYTVTLTRRATFVTLTLDNQYADFDFVSTAKPDQTKAQWTVTSRVSSPLVSEYRHVNETNK